MMSVAPTAASAEDAERYREHTCEFSLFHGSQGGVVSAIDAKKDWELHENDPSFFVKLHILEDGGLCHANTLFKKDRWLWASLSVVFLFMNLYFVVVLNIRILVDAESWLIDPNDKKHSGTIQRGLVINGLVNLMSNRVMEPQVLLSVLELIMFVTFLLLQMIMCFWHICFKTGSYRWHAVARLFWDVIPETMSLSAMRLLHYVTPSIIIPALNAQLLGIVERHGKYWGLHLGRFICLRLFAAVIGYDAFVVKFHEAVKLADDATTDSSAILNSLAFLNQMLGIVQVSRFVHRRLFVYIFGGKDSAMSDKEELLLRTWISMLAQRIWYASRPCRLPFAWFCAVMISYTDHDFQYLTQGDKSEASQSSPKLAFQ